MNDDTYDWMKDPLGVLPKPEVVMAPVTHHKITWAPIIPAYSTVDELRADCEAPSGRGPQDGCGKCENCGSWVRFFEDEINGFTGWWTFVGWHPMGAAYVPHPAIDCKMIRAKMENER